MTPLVSLCALERGLVLPLGGTGGTLGGRRAGWGVKIVTVGQWGGHGPGDSGNTHGAVLGTPMAKSTPKPQPNSC